MKKLLIVILIVVSSFVAVAHAETPQEKRKEIERMLRLTGMEKLTSQIMGQMIASLKKQMPDAPADFWNRFQQKMDPRELIEKIIPVYNKILHLARPESDQRLLRKSSRTEGFGDDAAGDAGEHADRPGMGRAHWQGGGGGSPATAAPATPNPAALENRLPYPTVSERSGVGGKML